MAEIQLLLADEANRRALAELVRDHHTPLTGPGLQDAELFLVDDASLPEYREALLAHKRELAPVFCPVVLIRRDRTPVTVDLPEPEPDPSGEVLLVNEVVTAPVDQATLFRRIANLLVRRRHTTELQEQNQRLERFASVVSHDLRNPLNVAQGRIGLAREEYDSEHLEVSAAAVDRSLDLIADLLTLVHDGETVREIEPVDLAALAERSLQSVETGDATVHVETDRTVRADRSRLEQLLGNLFGNAVEHAGPDVTITLGELADGFYVADDGPGIPEELSEQVFEDGFSSGNGTGLGLQIVERIAEAHGWTVAVAESEGGGARFEVTGVESLEG